MAHRGVRQDPPGAPVARRGARGCAAPPGRGAQRCERGPGVPRPRRLGTAVSGCAAPRESFQRGEGREKWESITAGLERGEGEAACLCCRGQWVPQLSSGGGSGAASSSLNLFRCFHSGWLHRSRIEYPFKCNVDIFDGCILLFCEIYPLACVSLGMFRKNKRQSLTRKGRRAVRLRLQ